MKGKKNFFSFGKKKRQPISKAFTTIPYRLWPSPFQASLMFLHHIRLNRKKMLKYFKTVHKNIPKRKRGNIKKKKKKSCCNEGQNRSFSPSTWVEKQRLGLMGQNE